MYSKETGEMVASLPFLALDRKNKKENQYESDQMQTATVVLRQEKVPVKLRFLY